LKSDARIISNFSTIDERDWAELDHKNNPFLSWAFLNALETSHSVTPETGWTPHHLAIFENKRLVAFAPAYIKTHSHGEFVFDWAWANAYQQHGLDYYPKLLTAIPYSPVTGPRLLTQRTHPDRETLRNNLVRLAIDECQRMDLSSWHCNFTSEADGAVLEQTDLLSRQDIQFHWYNRDFASFDAFLSLLRSRKRKSILRERQQVRAAGFRFEWKSGEDLTEQDLDFVYHCYRNTFQAHGNHAALQPGFFRMLSEGLGQGLQVALATKQKVPIAMSLFLTGGGRLYGRYWGCTEEARGLHFEAAYYQGIEYCIGNGIGIFESGAQGEHKISRGFVPSLTHSFHLVRHAAFRSAIAEHLEHEADWLAGYRAELEAQLPFRRDSS
jgi:predicted N-acyltransferase